MSIDPQTLKALRKKLNLKQTEIAEIFGVTQVAYGRWENGNVPIPSYVMEKINRMAELHDNWQLDKVEDYYYENKSKSSSSFDSAYEEIKTTNEYLKKQYDDAMLMLRKAQDSIERLSITNANLAEKLLGKFKGSLLQPQEIDFSKLISEGKVFRLQEVALEEVA